MGKIIALSNQKGGVGKTTISFNSGKILASRGHKTLLVDNDPQGNLSDAVFAQYEDDYVGLILDERMRPNLHNVQSLYESSEKLVPLAAPGVENLDILPAESGLSEVSTRQFDVVTFNFKERLLELAEDYDYILIDCLPSFGTLQTAAHMTSDYLLIPAMLDKFSFKGVKKQLETASQTKRRLNPNLDLLGVVLNQVSASKLNMQDHFAEMYSEEYGDKIFSDRITTSVRVSEGVSEGMSIFEYKKHSDQSRQMQGIVSEIVNRIEGVEA